MSRNLKQFVAVLKDYAVEHAYDVDYTLRDALVNLRGTGTPLEQATVVEDLARSTWHVLIQDGVSLPLATPYHYFLARPYDDGEARLVICTATQVVINDLWPLSGSLTDWFRTITGLAEALQAYAQTLRPADAVS